MGERTYHSPNCLPECSSLSKTRVRNYSFTLFCSIMQVARPFYEHADEKTATSHAEVAPIVRLCQRIHDELLMNADYELATHLNSIEILPQIFLTYVFSHPFYCSLLTLPSADGYACCLVENFPSKIPFLCGMCCSHMA